MKTFSTKVDLRNKREMIDFLTNHFRYNTMNSWNHSTSYAHNVKVYNLGLTREQEDKLWDMIECEDFYDEINYLKNDFASVHNYSWQVGFNGKSGGYLVLYQGYTKPSEHKSFCTNCGQRNFTSVAETGTRCGRCGEEARVDYKTPPMQIGIYPGKDTDMGEDFEDWDMYDLKNRVRLVQEFDKLCDDILALVVSMIDNAEVEEETIYVPKTVKKLNF